jgi:hypothetical protein
MSEHLLHSLAIATLAMFAGPWQYLSVQAAARRTEREAAFENVQAESIDSSPTPAETKISQFRFLDVPGAYNSVLIDYGGKSRSAFLMTRRVHTTAPSSSNPTCTRRSKLPSRQNAALINGKFNTVDVPGAQQTFLNRISNSGNVAGTLIDVKKEIHGIVGHSSPFVGPHDVKRDPHFFHSRSAVGWLYEASIIDKI